MPNATQIGITYQKLNVHGKMLRFRSKEYIDFARLFKGHNFLILVDAYTKWLDVHIAKNITAQTTVKKCQEIFAKFGLPVQLYDNFR